MEGIVVFSIDIHPAGIILRMRPANERWRYNVTSSLIGIDSENILQHYFKGW